VANGTRGLVTWVQGRVVLLQRLEFDIVAKVFGDVAVVHTREDVRGRLVRRIVRDADTLVREGGRLDLSVD